MPKEKNIGGFCLWQHVTIIAKSPSPGNTVKTWRSMSTIWKEMVRHLYCDKNKLTSIGEEWNSLRSVLIKNYWPKLFLSHKVRIEETSFIRSKSWFWNMLVFRIKVILFHFLQVNVQYKCMNLLGKAKNSFVFTKILKSKKSHF